MNELIVTTQAAVISCNFEEIEAELSRQMTAYEDLEVTEANLKERSADVATLRKIRKAIDDKRKQVKAEYDKPLKEFEGQVKRLTGIIDSQIDRLNAQIKDFDQKRIAEKQAHIRSLYEQIVDEYADFLPFEKIYSPKWNNNTCSDKDIVSDLQQAVVDLRSDLNVITALGSPIEAKLIEVYKRNGNNLSAAVTMHKDFTEAKKEEEALAVPEPIKTLPEPVHEPGTYMFTVYSEEDAEAVRSYLNLFGIRYKEAKE